MLEKAAEDFGPFSKEMDEKLRQVGYCGYYRYYRFCRYFIWWDTQYLDIKWILCLQMF